MIKDCICSSYGPCAQHQEFESNTIHMLNLRIRCWAECTYCNYGQSITLNQFDLWKAAECPNCYAKRNSNNDL